MPLRLILACTLILLSGCGLEMKRNRDSNGAPNASSIQCTTNKSTPVDLKVHFETQVLPTLVQNCASCHGTGAAARTQHSDPNAEVSYNVARGLLFNDQLQKRGTDGHCTNCAAAGVGKQAFLDQLSQWKTLELSPTESVCDAPASTPTPTPTPSVTPSPDPAKFIFTQSTLIPTLNMPGANGGPGAFKYMRFALDGLGAPSAILEIGVRWYTTGIIEVGALRAYVGAGTVNFTGLQVWIVNGTESESAETLAGKNYTVTPPATAINPSLVPLRVTPLESQGVVLPSLQSSGDELKLSFESIQFAP